MSGILILGGSLRDVFFEEVVGQLPLATQTSLPSVYALA